MRLPGNQTGQNLKGKMEAGHEYVEMVCRSLDNHNRGLGLGVYPTSYS